MDKEGDLLRDLFRTLSAEELKRVRVPSAEEIDAALRKSRIETEAAREYLMPHTKHGGLYYR